MDKCPKCRSSQLFWDFSQNTFKCLICDNFSHQADISLLVALGTPWSVIFAERESGQKVYILRKGDVYVGTLKGYLGGVVYFEGSKIDDESEENTLSILKAVYESLGVSTLHDSHEVITYIP